MNIAFGEVVNVKTIPSRGVTRIEIEIPSEFHVAATELLFGKPAFVFPVASKPAMLPGGASYGVMPFARAIAMTQRGEKHAQPLPSTGGMFGGDRRAPSYVSIAGQACREDTAFWYVLNDKTGMPVTNEAQAITALRVALNIESRSNLSSNVQAQAMLNDLLAEARALQRMPT